MRLRERAAQMEREMAAEMERVRRSLRAEIVPYGAYDAEIGAPEPTGPVRIRVRVSGQAISHATHKSKSNRLRFEV